MKNFFKILKIAKPYWKYLIITGISLLAVSVLNLITPWKVRDLINLLSGEDISVQMTNIRNISFILIGAYIARAIFTYFYRYLSHVAAWKLVADMRVLVYEHLQKFP